MSARRLKRMCPSSDVSENRSPILWRPTPEYVQRSRLFRFMQRHGIADYPALYERSIAAYEATLGPSHPSAKQPVAACTIIRLE